MSKVTKENLKIVTVGTKTYLCEPSDGELVGAMVLLTPENGLSQAAVGEYVKRRNLNDLPTITMTGDYHASVTDLTPSMAAKVTMVLELMVEAKKRQKAVLLNLSYDALALGK